MYFQGQLEQEEGAGEGTEKKVDALRLSLTSLKDAELEEDPLKTNRALAALLETERGPEATPIGVEEVCAVIFLSLACGMKNTCVRRFIPSSLILFFWHDSIVPTFYTFNHFL